ncbi:hypothetical protein EVAR_23195_1 [Eumeta japonica]|uniref:Uncharacterized protein n=1 Tax=Eumeta variegata TaxID=151549 RepID=A0A4C1VE65_EUMVA|nr:hypothetical protein EVAR_23195_1 [Eumeta japonica]
MLCADGTQERSGEKRPELINRKDTCLDDEQTGLPPRGRRREAASGGPVARRPPPAGGPLSATGGRHYDVVTAVHGARTGPNYNFKFCRPKRCLASIMERAPDGGCEKEPALSTAWALTE